jgi:hypothetical protein
MQRIVDSCAMAGALSRLWPGQTDGGAINPEPSAEAEEAIANPANEATTKRSESLRDTALFSPGGVRI